MERSVQRPKGARLSTGLCLMPHGHPALRRVRTTGRGLRGHAVGFSGADSPTTVRRERLRQNRVFCPAFVGQVARVPNTWLALFGAKSCLPPRQRTAHVLDVPPLCLRGQTLGACRWLHPCPVALPRRHECARPFRVCVGHPSLVPLRRYLRKRASPRLVESGTRQATASLQVDTRPGTWFRGITNKLSRAVFGVGWSALLAATQMRPYLIFDSIDGCLNFLSSSFFYRLLTHGRHFSSFSRSLYQF